MDSHWLEQCREKDSLAIEKMVRAYQKDAYRLALSILDDPDEAEDGTQETFLAALRAISSFREDAAFKTWLFSTTINVCRSRLRRGKNRGRLQQILQSLFHLRGEVEHPERTAMQNQADAELWNAISASTKNTASRLCCATIMTCRLLTSPRCLTSRPERSTPA